jgi:hypothetical protein
VLQDGSLGTLGVLEMAVKDNVLVLTLPAHTTWFREQLEKRLDESNEAIRKILKNELGVEDVRIKSL